MAAFFILSCRALQRQAGIDQFAPRPFNSLLCGALGGVTWGNLGGLEHTQHPPEAVRPKDVRDAADPGPLSGQCREHLDVAAGEQSRARRVPRADGDRGVPAVLLHEDLGVEPAKRPRRLVVALVAFAVLGLSEFVHDRYCREAVEHPRSHRDQLVGSTDENRRLDGQIRQHLQRVLVAERRDDAESSAAGGSPYATLRSVDGEFDLLEWRLERPLSSVKVL